MPQSHAQSAAARPLVIAVATSNPGDRFERQALGFALLVLCFAIVVTVIQAMREPLAPTASEVRDAFLTSGYTGALCPDGWAADHARVLDLTEAEITAWYVAESFRASNAAVLREAKAFFDSPADFRTEAGDDALTLKQINLCIAESRRLI